MSTVKGEKFPRCLSRHRIAAVVERVPLVALEAPLPCPRVRMGSFFL